MMSPSADNFLCPPQVFSKINFYGASKINPDPVGLGGLIWNVEAENLKVFAVTCDTTTNNVVVFFALDKASTLCQKWASLVSKFKGYCS